MARSSGLEDILFSTDTLRRQHIMKIFSNYDVDPNMNPDGSMVPNRIDQLVSDPTIGFDSIRRLAQRTARNGFTLRNIEDQALDQMPIMLSDPNRFLDTGPSFDGEQEFGPEGSGTGIELAESNPLIDEHGHTMSILMAEADSEDDIYPIEEDEGALEDQLLTATEEAPEGTDTTPPELIAGEGLGETTEGSSVTMGEPSSPSPDNTQEV